MFFFSWSLCIRVCYKTSDRASFDSPDVTLSHSITHWLVLQYIHLRVSGIESNPAMYCWNLAGVLLLYIGGRKDALTQTDTIVWFPFCFTGCCRFAHIYTRMHSLYIPQQNTEICKNFRFVFKSGLCVKKNKLYIYIY